jgi:hypothetical protein
MKSKEDLKKDADKVAAHFGYKPDSLSLDVINVKDAYCNGYANGVKELEERNKVLEDALQGIVDNWTERMSGDIEVWKDPSSSVSGKGYYSPSASLVSSEFIAKGREALSNNQK